MVSKNARLGSRAKFSSAAAFSAFLDKANDGKGEASPEAAFTEAVLDQENPTNTEETGKTIETNMTNQEAPAFELTQQDTPKAEQALSGLSLLDEQITPITQIANARSTVTKASCVRALEKSVGFSRNAFYLEVGVCLAIFASSTTGTDLATKRVVRDVYAKAGYDVEAGGADYKTVSRRIITCGKLYDKMGDNAINEAMRGLKDLKAIESLCDYLEVTGKFKTMNAVLEYVGEPVPQTNTPEVRAARSAALVRSLNSNTAQDMSLDERMEAQREERRKKQEESSDGVSVYSGALYISIPRDATPAEVRAMATRLMEVADSMEAEIGTPEDQRNRAMHS